MKKATANSVPKLLPPKLPGTTVGLERVIVLLGNRVQAQLKKKSKTELIQLIDAYPDATTASLWKQSIRQLIKEKQIKENLIGENFGLSAETVLMLDWVKEALSELYWETEKAYDVEFVKQMDHWFKICPLEISPKVYVAKKFLELQLAWASSSDSENFDLTQFNFNLDTDTLVESELTFINPLLKLALQKVDWEILGDYLVSELGLLTTVE